VSLLERIEPTLGADEDNYRRHFLATDTAQAKGSAWLVLGLVAIVLVLEIRSFAPELIAEVLIVRLLFFAVVIATFIGMRGDTTPAALDRAALIFSTAFAAQFVVLLSLRPPSRVDDLGMLVLILSCYALSPAPVRYRTVAPVLLAVGGVLVLWLARDSEPIVLWPTAIVLVAANALGFWGSARLHTQRRRQYQSQERLRLSLQERDELIDRLRHSHKMEAMGRIVGGVAHDFNNILGSMFAAVEFILADLPSDSTSREDAKILRASVKRGADLTKQLLAFSRRHVLEPRVVSLNDLVSDAQRMLTRTIGEQYVITTSLDEELPAVRVDPGQIQQILLNLSVNARDAMPSGGTLLMQTRQAVLAEPTVMSRSVAPAGSYVVLTVSDDGTGMDAATLAQIFEPFFTTKPKGRGTGLGLSTVFGIVGQSGGHIRVTSAPDRGTTFDVFLPSVAERPIAIVMEPEAHFVSRGTETVLLAEDDDALRGLLARVLGAHGYQVLQASNGVEALRVSDEHHGELHLLASDVVMPSMGGQRLAQELSVKRPGIKVLFMSGYTDDAFTDGKLGPGEAFLQKPVDPTVLIRRVRSMLDGEQRAQS
jgi:two-component system cell cycle sensor histidine kinase/response regulator CckA